MNKKVKNLLQQDIRNGKMDHHQGDTTLAGAGEDKWVGYVFEKGKGSQKSKVPTARPRSRDEIWTTVGRQRLGVI